MKLTKSVSGGQPEVVSNRGRRAPTIDKLLSRPTAFRPLAPEDLKHFWATARQTGKLARMALPFDPTVVGKEQFRELFPDYVDETYDSGWLLLGKATAGWPYRDELMPVGAVFSNFVGSIMFITDTVWFPWASKRNILEVFAHFVRDVSRKTPVLEFALWEDRRFFEHLCNVNIMRRVGTSHSVYAKRAAVFEAVTRWQ